MAQAKEVRERFANPLTPVQLLCVLIDILVMDVSPSMDEPGFEPRRSKRRLMNEAIQQYVAIKHEQRPEDLIALITYESNGFLCCPILPVKRFHRRILEGLEEAAAIRGGGTRIVSGLRIALDLVRSDGFSTDVGLPVVRRVLAYSDGYDAEKRGALRCADALKELGVCIDTFGIGKQRTDVDEAFLRQIATHEQEIAHYRFLGDGDLIRQTFAELGKGALTFEG